MGFITPDLILYVKSVWLIWLIVVGAVATVWGEYADRFAPELKVRVNKVVPLEVRRPLEILIMMVALLWASFSAWEDQRTLFQKVELQRQSSQRWLGIWKERSEEQWKSIHGKSGYLGQIKNLTDENSKLKTAPEKIGTNPHNANVQPALIPQSFDVQDANDTISGLIRLYGDRDHITPEEAADLVPIPETWINDRLQKMGKNYRVKSNGLRFNIVPASIP